MEGLVVNCCKKLKISGKTLMLAMLIATNAIAEVKQKAPEISPHWEFVVRDASLLAQVTGKNAWYKEFRQSSLYLGLMQKYAPVLYSAADEYGTGMNAWKGTLIEHLYGKIMQDHPMMISYYNRGQLISPLGISVMQLSQGEKSILETLIKVFRSGDDQEITVDRNSKSMVKSMVTPLMIRGQRFAILVSSQCMTLSRDPQVVVRSQERCAKKTLPRGEDASLSVNLLQHFPALAGIKNRFFNAEDDLQVKLQWNSSLARFEATSASLSFHSKPDVLLKEKLSANMIQALPANSIFFANLQLPKLFPLSHEKLASYLAKSPEALKTKGSTAITLFYAPVQEESKPGRIAGGLLMQSGRLDPKGLENLVGIFQGAKRGEIFVRPVCGDLTVVSNRLEVIQLIENTCSRKNANFGDFSQKWTREILKNSYASNAYFSLGKLLTQYLKIGWAKSKGNVKSSSPSTEGLPDDINQAQRLFESLDDIAMSGNLESTKLLMKTFR